MFAEFRGGGVRLIHTYTCQNPNLSRNQNLMNLDLHSLLLLYYLMWPWFPWFPWLRRSVAWSSFWIWRLLASCYHWHRCDKIHMTVLTWWYPKLTRGSLVKVFRMITKTIRRRILNIPTLRLVTVRSMIPGIHMFLSVRLVTRRPGGRWNIRIKLGRIKGRVRC